MTDEPTDYPPAWDETEPHPDDPRFGDGLEPWHPDNGQRAEALRLLSLYVKRDHRFNAEFLNFAADRYRHTDWPEAFLTILESFATTAVGAQGEELTIARAESDHEHALLDTIEYGER